MAEEDVRRRALVARLEQEPLVAAWLFGSAARDDMGPLSDVDVAVLPETGLTDRQRLDLIGSVASAGQKAWGVAHCDVVLVDEASPQVAFDAVHGDILVDHDPGRRVLAEARIRSTYHDRRYYEDRRRRLNSERWRRGEFA